MAVSYTFNKNEKLCGRKAIGELFEEGEAFSLYPFRVFWSTSNEHLPAPVRVAVSVPKKMFKKAVDRNRIKRLIREAWRHNKHRLYDQLVKSDRQISLMLVYTESSMPDYSLINNKIEAVVKKLLLILSD